MIIKVKRAAPDVLASWADIEVTLDDGTPLTGIKSVTLCMRESCDPIVALVEHYVSEVEIEGVSELITPVYVCGECGRCTANALLAFGGIVCHSCAADRLARAENEAACLAWLDEGGAS